MTKLTRYQTKQGICPMTNINHKQTRLFIIILLTIAGLMGSFVLGYNSGKEQVKDEWNLKSLKDIPDLTTLSVFLDENTIDENTWVKNEYNCYTFSTDLVDAARIAGYRSQIVVKSNYMETGTSHAQVQFWVENVGLWILVEPQDDGIIKTETSYTKYGSWGG